VVVSVDAKTGIQALNRTQPLLPVTFGKTKKRTHDYVRAGTIDLYAAIDIRTGKVIASLSPTHATLDFLRLMKKVVAAYPGKKIHVVSTMPRCTPRRRPHNGWASRRTALFFILRQRVLPG